MNAVRDPERIDAFLERLRKIWMKNPDLRFGQLILNISRNPSLLYNILSREDDEFIEKMEMYYEKYYTPEKRSSLLTLSDEELAEAASNARKLSDEERKELVDKCIQRSVERIQRRLKGL